MKLLLKGRKEWYEKEKRKRLDINLLRMYTLYWCAFNRAFEYFFELLFCFPLLSLFLAFHILKEHPWIKDAMMMQRRGKKEKEQRYSWWLHWFFVHETTMLSKAFKKCALVFELNLLAGFPSNASAPVFILLQLPAGNSAQPLQRRSAGVTVSARKNYDRRSVHSHQRHAFLCENDLWKRETCLNEIRWQTLRKYDTLTTPANGCISRKFNYG